jgi:hypothetical protein
MQSVLITTDVVSSNLDWWFSPGLPVSSTNKTDCQVALNTIKQTNEQPFLILYIKKLIFH